MSGPSEVFGLAARDLSGVAARLLGWWPSDFWSATPAELRAALAPDDASASLDRAHFNRLMDLEHG